MPARITVILSIIILSCSVLYADIIITTDDMVLNGKVIEESDSTVKFGNYHGIFIIDRSRIKSMVKTGSYEGDVKILNEMGKVVNESEIEINYNAGLEKLGDDGKGRKKETSPDYMLMFSSFFNINSGQLADVIKYSHGAGVSLHIPAGSNGFAGALHLTHVSLQTDYFGMENGDRAASGFRFSAGPTWLLPASILELDIEYSISAGMGIGYYSVTGTEETLDAVKWNIFFSTGPVFSIHSITIAPAIQLHYIYDSRAPLYGIGAVLGIGFRF